MPDVCESQKRGVKSHAWVPSRNHPSKKPYSETGNCISLSVCMLFSRFPSYFFYVVLYACFMLDAQSYVDKFVILHMGQNLTKMKYVQCDTNQDVKVYSLVKVGRMEIINRRVKRKILIQNVLHTNVMPNILSWPEKKEDEVNDVQYIWDPDPVGSVYNIYYWLSWILILIQPLNT